MYVYMLRIHVYVYMCVDDLPRFAPQSAPAPSTPSVASIYRCRTPEPDKRTKKPSQEERNIRKHKKTEHTNKHVKCVDMSISLCIDTKNNRVQPVAQTLHDTCYPSR